jgi:hypothetical protein
MMLSYHDYDCVYDVESRQDNYPADDDGGDSDVGDEGDMMITMTIMTMGRHDKANTCSAGCRYLGTIPKCCVGRLLGTYET